jgi:hypothetical protein
VSSAGAFEGRDPMREAVALLLEQRRAIVEVRGRALEASASLLDAIEALGEGSMPFGDHLHLPHEVFCECFQLMRVWWGHGAAHSNSCSSANHVKPRDVFFDLSAGWTGRPRTGRTPDKYYGR